MRFAEQLLNLEYHSDAIYFTLAVLILLLPCTFTHQMTHFLCVCAALVIPAAELEQLGSYSPGVHGLPHLR